MSTTTSMEGTAVYGPRIPGVRQHTLRSMCMTQFLDIMNKTSQRSELGSE